jgi:hypothetical protein
VDSDDPVLAMQSDAQLALLIATHLAKSSRLPDGASCARWRNG